jgi:hypothetical protein
MPSWAENELTITGPNVRRVLETICAEPSNDEDTGLIDFDRIIPYPQHFKDLDQRARDYGEKFRAIANTDPERQEKLNALAAEYGVEPGTTHLKDGFNSGGYEWRCEHWMTKWNAVHTILTTRPDASRAEIPAKLTCAYCKTTHKTAGMKVLMCQQCGSPLPDSQPLQAFIEFDTAWCPPTPVIDKLASLFPDHQFDLKYYEGGIGFCGHVGWSGGVKTFHELDEYDGPRGG